jgi:hypothetical protein
MGVSPRRHAVAQETPNEDTAQLVPARQPRHTAAPHQATTKPPRQAATASHVDTGAAAWQQHTQVNPGGPGRTRARRGSEAAGTRARTHLRPAGPFFDDAADAMTPLYTKSACFSVNRSFCTGAQAQPAAGAAEGRAALGNQEPQRRC